MYQLDAIMRILGFARCPMCQKWRRHFIWGNKDPAYKGIGVCYQCDTALEMMEDWIEEDKKNDTD